MIKTALFGLLMTLALPGLAAAEEKTCGQRIAEQAVLPAKMAQLMAAVGHAREAHAKLMLAGKSKEGKKEAAELLKLAKVHKGLAATFGKLSESMKKLYAMPGAPHDLAKMAADPKIAEAMKELVTYEKEMVALMQADLAAFEGAPAKGAAAAEGPAGATPGGAGKGAAAAEEPAEADEGVSEKSRGPKSKAAPSKPGAAPAKPPTKSPTPVKAPPPPPMKK